MHPTFEKTSMRVDIILVLCAMFVVGISQPATANTLCVNPSGSHGCYSQIQAAVNHAAINDVIDVEPGTYKEEVDIGTSLSLIGEGASSSVIDATGLAHGIFVDGFDHPGLGNVTIAGFTVKNALFEGILVVSALDVTIRDNHIVDNDKSPGLKFTGASPGVLTSRATEFMRPMKPATAVALFTWWEPSVRLCLTTLLEATPMAFSSATRPRRVATICSSTTSLWTTLWSAASFLPPIRLRGRRHPLSLLNMGLTTIRWPRTSLLATA